MYRARGQINRMIEMMNYPSDDYAATAPLNSEQINLLEETDLISVTDKIELICVSLGIKLTTELEIDPVKPEYSSNLAKLLAQLPFVYFRDHIVQKLNNGSESAVDWFQVSVNSRVSHFMEKYSDDLTEMENGILYGYPISSIRAFTTLIKSSRPKPHKAYQWFFNRVFSETNFTTEEAELQQWWEMVRQISPAIIQQAETEFTQKQLPD